MADYADCYEEKKGRYPTAEGYKQKEYKFMLAGKVDSRMDWFHKMAVNNPNERVIRYFEENGYEYEMWAIFDPQTQILTSNRYSCVNFAYHHVGAICEVCGIKD